MSNWTHVAAIFRINDLRVSDEQQLDFENVFGKEVNFDDDFSVWEEAAKNPEKFLPCGSEGSLNMSVWVEPNRSCLAAYTVSIFGDLRDHESIDEIIDWFDKKCEICWIRQAVITVDNERHGTRTKTYEGE